MVDFGFLHVLLRRKLANFATQANLPIAARYSDNPTPILKEDTGNIDVFNCGGGNPRSITEVIKVVESITGKQIDVVNGDRREGDPDYTSADITSISKTLNWTPTLDLEEMVRTHYNWVKK